MLLAHAVSVTQEEEVTVGIEESSLIDQSSVDFDVDTLQDEESTNFQKKIASCVRSILDEENLFSNDEMAVLVSSLSRLGFSKQDLKKINNANKEETRG